MIKSFCIAPVCVLLLSGCATITSGMTDVVKLTSTPNAEIAIKDEDGEAVYQGTTPATVTLDRGNGYFNGQSYQIDLSAPGYQNKTYNLETTLNPAYTGNLLLGGLVGLLLVDPATGAMWDLPPTADISLAPFTAPTPLSATDRKDSAAPLSVSGQLATPAPLQQVGQSKP